MDSNLSMLLQKGWIIPSYQDNCYSDFPRKIKHAFKSGEETVVFFLIDGFGWRFFKEYQKSLPFLKRGVEEGSVQKITSQFPSTTAAHVTLINTGMTPQESGIFEWFYYEPKVDRVIAPLLFSFAGDPHPNTLETHVKAEEIYPSHTLYEELKESGVESFVFSDASISHSPYSLMMGKGAHLIPFHSLEEGLEKLARLMQERRDKKSYYYFYFGEIDSKGHRVGIESPDFKKSIEHCFGALEEIFPELPPSLLFLTADHGMIEVDPYKTFYLNERLPDILKWIKKNKNGELIVPSGSCRDFFLYIEEEHLRVAEEYLKKGLEGVALVFRTKDLITAGLFGKGNSSSEFLARVGNLLILPFARESVWWREKGHFDQHFFASHGGLTKEEMEIPFLRLKICK